MSIGRRHDKEAHQVHQTVLARGCRLALQQMGVFARDSPQVLNIVPK